MWSDRMTNIFRLPQQNQITLDVSIKCNQQGPFLFREQQIILCIKDILQHVLGSGDLVVDYCAGGF